MEKLSIEHEGTLYRNQRPGYRAQCAFLPNVVSLSDKELLCLYRLGQAFYSVDGKLAVLRSTDAGVTWHQDGEVCDPGDDGRPYSYSAPHCGKLSDGTLLLISRRNDCSKPNQVFFNPETGGAQPCDIVLFRSVDNGKSWSKPSVLALPGEGLTDTPSNIIELDNGRLFLGCELWKAWDDTNPLHIKCFGVFSDDGGVTWAERVDFPSSSDSVKMYSHSRYTKMLDGRVGTLQWSQEVGSNKNFDLHFTVSDKEGKNWSVPQPTGLMAQTSWMADLGSGTLAAAYTTREGMAPGVFVVLSFDEGKSWDVANQVMVWDAVGQEFLGVVHRPDYPASHDNIAFGKPNLVRLPDGALICSWWCTQACVTHVRYAKLRIE